MTVLQLTDRVKSYVNTQLDSMSRTNPMISFMKPLVTRVLDKNFSKVTKALDLIADENGNIDIEGILSEMMQLLYSGSRMMTMKRVLNYGITLKRTNMEG